MSTPFYGILIKKSLRLVFEFPLDKFLAFIPELERKEIPPFVVCLEKAAVTFPHFLLKQYIVSSCIVVIYLPALGSFPD